MQARQDLQSEDNRVMRSWVVPFPGGRFPSASGVASDTPRFRLRRARGILLRGSHVREDVPCGCYELPCPIRLVVREAIIAARAIRIFKNHTALAAGRCDLACTGEAGRDLSSERCLSLASGTAAGDRGRHG
jgi:hypothetical protein